MANPLELAVKKYSSSDLVLGINLASTLVPVLTLKQVTLATNKQEIPVSHVCLFFKTTEIVLFCVVKSSKQVL